MPDRPFPPTADPLATGSIADVSVTTDGTKLGTGSGSSYSSSDRYVMGTEIARGGMGAVYRATDTVLNREVAVKVLLDKYDPTSGTARRFADEARITGQLQHPNIPAVHDLGILPDGRPFLAMKLIKGNTLDALLKDRSDPNAERGRLVAVFEGVCQAVAYAHAHGVIHRDLKPGNVMVGNFGEVQVMDWGLAKVLGASESIDPDETTPATAIQADRDSDRSFTRVGSVLGTPAYMPPEQAVGAIPKVDARSDVFGLGGILAVILTGRPPFVGKSAESTRLKAAHGSLDECFARLDGCGAEPELVALCKRCLSKNPEDRPANAGEVAKAVATLRVAADERARQAETNRARAETQAIEQRKRRRVQLALAGVVLVVAVGGGIAVVQVQSQRERDRIAADDRARREQRETRAMMLVQALATAEPRAVPILLQELVEYRDEARPHIQELATRPIEQRGGLHGRMAMLADPTTGPEETTKIQDLLGSYTLQCRADEFPMLLDQFAIFATPQMVTALWRGLELAPEPRRHEVINAVRLEAMLARLSPNSPKWAIHADRVSRHIIQLNLLEAEPFAEAMSPVRGYLVPSLMKRYAESRVKLESGKLTASELAEEASKADVTAGLLARYTTDQPKELAELVMTADGRHMPLFSRSIAAKQASVAERLEAEINKSLPADLPSSDHQREELARRKANAAVVVLQLNRPEKAWPLLKHSPDPRTRSYLIHRLFPLGADPAAIIRRLDEETDVSARRALLLALGEFDEATLSTARRSAIMPKLQQMYRDDPDAGLHAAAEWLLRQWQQDDWINGVKDQWAKDREGRDRRIAAKHELVANPKQRAPSWYVNSQGQTFTVIPGPVEFVMGSPKSEKDRDDVETQHRRRISRTFAIACKTVTLAEYRGLTREKYELPEKHARALDVPVVGMNWYMVASFCNLLSKEEGIPEDQWCYEINGPHEVKVKDNYLSLSGYRLPTEAETEYAIRAGALTSRCYGETEDLLGNYGWYTRNSGDLLQRVGRKKPNDLGIFDMHGNCYTWCQDEYDEYPKSMGDLPVEDRPSAAVIGHRSRSIRGGSFGNPATTVRSACRDNDTPMYRGTNYGIRLARTIVP